MDDVFKTALQKTMPGRFKQKELAEQVNISVSYFNDLYKGRKSGQEHVRRAIASALGYEDYEAFLDVGRLELGIKTLRPSESGLSGGDSLREYKAFFQVPFSDHMSLKPGGSDIIEVTDSEKNSAVMIHGPSLGRSNARNLQAFRVAGDEMEPLIAKEGIVLVDLSQNKLLNLCEGRIYLLCWELDQGQCAVRRLKWVERGQLLAIEAENPSHETVYKRARDIRLIGRIIWSWREH